jgi:hypothetical protein
VFDCTSGSLGDGQHHCCVLEGFGAVVVEGEEEGFVCCFDGLVNEAV